MKEVYTYIVALSLIWMLLIHIDIVRIGLFKREKMIPKLITDKIIKVLSK